MKYLIFLLLPIFAACNHNPTIPEIQTIEVVKKISIPHELLQECTTFNQQYPKRIEDILLEDLELMQLYGECRLRHKSLLNTIQEIVK